MDRLSPSSRTASSRSWADIVDEVNNDDVVCESEVQAKEGPVEYQDSGRSDLPSVGSAPHYAGRCKPCAFFHTKGCQNDKECQFCHLCPPLEKQRRKRLRERISAKLHQGAQDQLGAPPRAYGESQCYYAPFYQMEMGFQEQQQQRQHGGHLRQTSGTSTISTQSNCSGLFSHSRQSSGSSWTPSAVDVGLASTADVGMVGMDEPMVAIALAQAVPSPHHQNIVCHDSRGRVTKSCGATGPMNDRTAMGPMIDCGASRIVGMPSDQIPSGNMVFVPIPVPMSMDMQTQPNFVDQSMPYACFPQHCAPPMAAIPGNQEPWFYSVTGGYERF